MPSDPFVSPSPPPPSSVVSLLMILPSSADGSQAMRDFLDAWSTSCGDNDDEDNAVVNSPSTLSSALIAFEKAVTTLVRYSTPSLWPSRLAFQQTCCEAREGVGSRTQGKEAEEDDADGDALVSSFFLGRGTMPASVHVGTHSFAEHFAQLAEQVMAGGCFATGAAIGGTTRSDAALPNVALEVVSSALPSSDRASRTASTALPFSFFPTRNVKVPNTRKKEVGPRLSVRRRFLVDATDFKASERILVAKGIPIDDVLCNGRTAMDSVPPSPTCPLCCKTFAEYFSDLITLLRDARSRCGRGNDDNDDNARIIVGCATVGGVLALESILFEQQQACLRKPNKREEDAEDTRKRGFVIMPDAGGLSSPQGAGGCPAPPLLPPLLVINSWAVCDALIHFAESTEEGRVVLSLGYSASTSAVLSMLPLEMPKKCFETCGLHIVYAPPPQASPLSPHRSHFRQYLSYLTQQDDGRKTLGCVGPSAAAVSSSEGSQSHGSSATADCSLHQQRQQQLNDVPSKPPRLEKEESNSWQSSVIRQRCYARVGLMGNPSDNFNGKCISLTVKNYWVDVLLLPTRGSSSDFNDASSMLLPSPSPPPIRLLPNPISDQTVFGSFLDTFANSKKDGYSGGLRLIQATLAKFYEYVLRHCGPNSDDEDSSEVENEAGGGDDASSINTITAAPTYLYGSRKGRVVSKSQQKAARRLLHRMGGVRGGVGGGAEGGFSLAYHTNIPRQVGLAGSSCIVVAVLKALCTHYGVTLVGDDDEVKDESLPEGVGVVEKQGKPLAFDASSFTIPLSVLPSIALSVEAEELGIAAGLQDRAVQTYEGLVAMDFNKAHLASTGCGIYRQYGGGGGAGSNANEVVAADPSSSPPTSAAFSASSHFHLPPLFLAVARDPSDSGKMHQNIKQRYEQGDAVIKAAAQKWAGFVDGTLHVLGLASTSPPRPPRMSNEDPDDGYADAENHHPIENTLSKNDHFVLFAHQHGGAAHNAFCDFIDANCNLRRQIYTDPCLGRKNLEMVEIAKSFGAAAKFPGSGGAILVAPRVGTCINAAAAGDGDGSATATAAESGGAGPPESNVGKSTDIFALRRALEEKGYYLVELVPHFPNA